MIACCAAPPVRNICQRLRIALIACRSRWTLRTSDACGSGVRSARVDGAGEPDACDDVSDIADAASGAGVTRVAPSAAVGSDSGALWTDRTKARTSRLVIVPSVNAAM